SFRRTRIENQLLNVGIARREPLHDLGPNGSREVPQASAAAKAARKLVKKFAHRNAFCLGGKEQTKDGQDGVTRRKCSQKVPLPHNIGAGEKSAIGFPTANGLAAFAASSLHSRDDIGRTDAGLRFNYFC